MASPQFEDRPNLISIIDRLVEQGVGAAEEARLNLEQNRTLGATQFGSEFVPVEIQYLVKPYFPIGKGILIDADGGTGKSSFVVALSAWASRGRCHFGEFKAGRPLRTLYLHKGEDQSEELHTIYLGNDGDPSQIHYWRGNLKLDNEGIGRIEETIVTLGIDIVVFDALFYFLAGTADSKKLMSSSFDVQAIIQPLLDMYARTGATGFHIRHTKKGLPGEDAAALGMGTVQFRNSHRGQLVMRWHPDQQAHRGVVVVTDEKGSILVQRGDPFYFRRVNQAVEIINNMPDVDPFTESKRTAGRGKPGPEPKKTTEVAAWLYYRLKDGPRRVHEIRKFSEEEKFSADTLYKAKEILCLMESKDESGKKIWELDPYATLPEWVEDLPD